MSLFNVLMMGGDLASSIGSEYPYVTAIPSIALSPSDRAPSKYQNWGYSNYKLALKTSTSLTGATSNYYNVPSEMTRPPLVNWNSAATNNSAHVIVGDNGQIWWAKESENLTIWRQIVVSGVGTSKLRRVRFDGQFHIYGNNGTWISISINSAGNTYTINGGCSNGVAIGTVYSNIWVIPATCDIYDGFVGNPSVGRYYTPVTGTIYPIHYFVGYNNSTGKGLLGFAKNDGSAFSTGTFNTVDTGPYVGSWVGKATVDVTRPVTSITFGNVSYYMGSGTPDTGYPLVNGLLVMTTADGKYFWNYGFTDAYREWTGSGVDGVVGSYAPLYDSYCPTVKAVQNDFSYAYVRYPTVSQKSGYVIIAGEPIKDSSFVVTGFNTYIIVKIDRKPPYISGLNDGVAIGYGSSIDTQTTGLYYNPTIYAITGYDPRITPSYNGTNIYKTTTNGGTHSTITDNVYFVGTNGAVVKKSNEISYSSYSTTTKYSYIRSPVVGEATLKGVTISPNYMVVCGDNGKILTSSVTTDSNGVQTFSAFTGININVYYPSTIVLGTPFTYSVYNGYANETFYMTLNNGVTTTRIPATGTYALDSIGRAQITSDDVSAAKSIFNADGLIYYYNYNDVTVNFYFSTSGTVTKTVKILPASVGYLIDNLYDTDSIKSIAYSTNKDRFVAVGQKITRSTANSDCARILYTSGSSVNSITWNQVYVNTKDPAGWLASRDPATYKNNAAQGTDNKLLHNLKSIDYGNGKFIAVGDYGAAYISWDDNPNIWVPLPSYVRGTQIFGGTSYYRPPTIMNPNGSTSNPEFNFNSVRYGKNGVWCIVGESRMSTNIQNIYYGPTYYSPNQNAIITIYDESLWNSYEEYSSVRNDRGRTNRDRVLNTNTTTFDYNWNNGTNYYWNVPNLRISTFENICDIIYITNVTQTSKSIFDYYIVVGRDTVYQVQLNNTRQDTAGSGYADLSIAAQWSLNDPTIMLTSVYFNPNNNLLYISAATRTSGGVANIYILDFKNGTPSFTTVLSRTMPTDLDKNYGYTEIKTGYTYHGFLKIRPSLDEKKILIAGQGGIWSTSATLTTAPTSGDFTRWDSNGTDSATKSYYDTITFTDIASRY